MLARDATRSNDSVDLSPVRGSPPPPDAWRVADADDAFGTLDRVARYCVFSCTADSERCVDEACAAWNLERAAAGYLAGRWLDAQD